MNITLEDYRKIVGNNNNILNETRKKIQNLAGSLKELDDSSEESKKIWEKIDELSNMEFYFNNENSIMDNEAINNGIFEMSLEDLTKSIEAVYPFTKGKLHVSLFSIHCELNKTGKALISEMTTKESLNALKDSKFIFENSQNKKVRLWLDCDGKTLCIFNVPFKYNAQFTDGRNFLDGVEGVRINYWNTNSINFNLASKEDINKLNLSFIPNKEYIEMGDNSKGMGVNLEGVQQAIYNVAEKNAKLDADSTKDVTIKR